MKKMLMLLAVMLCFAGIAAGQEEKKFVESLPGNLKDAQNPSFTDFELGTTTLGVTRIKDMNETPDGNFYQISVVGTTAYFQIRYKADEYNKDAMDNAKKKFNGKVELDAANKTMYLYTDACMVDLVRLDDASAERCAGIMYGQDEGVRIFPTLKRLISEFDRVYRNELAAQKEKERKQREAATQPKQPAQPKVPPYLTADGPTNIDCEGGILKYEVKTNTSYSLEIPYEYESWIHLRNLKSPIDKESYILEMEYSKNQSSSTRGGSFRVYNNKGNSSTISVLQDACPVAPSKTVEEPKIREKKHHYHHNYLDHFWAIKLGPAANYWKFYDSDGNADDKNFNDHSVPQLGYNLVFCFEDLIGGPVFWGLNFGFSSNGYRLDYAKGDNEDTEYLLTHSFQFTPHFGLVARMGRGFAAEVYAGPYVGYDYFGMGKKTWKFNGVEYNYEYKIWNEDDHYWQDGGYNHLQYGISLSLGFWFGEGFNLDFTVQQGMSDIIKQSSGAYSRNFNAMARLGFKI